jgi:tRNA A-37 threonylcarbamoyl transferase component Bud32
MANEFNLKIWLHSLTNDSISSYKEIDEGVNGKVILHFGTSSRYITKSYRHLSDGLIRFNREITFIKQIQKLCKSRIPSLIGYDENNLIICQEFIVGKKCAPNSSLINEILNFVEIVNSGSDISSYPYKAANSMLKLEDIINEIKVRFDEERINMSATHTVYLNAIEETFQKLITSYNDINNSQNFINEHFKLLLSPSDIGPHNMLDTDKGFKFIDFEFAGVDSNIKLGFDLIVHPDLHFLDFVTEGIKGRFQSLFGFKLNEMPELLCALFKIKWSLLIMKKSRKGSKQLGENEKQFILDSM